MPLFGKDATTYHSAVLLDGDSVTADTATWAEAENIVDESDNFTSEDIDITTRATAKLGWNATASGPKNGEVTFAVLVEPGDALVAALRTAFEDSVPIALMFLSGPDDEDGSFGVAANWSISMTHGKPVKGAQTYEVTAKIYSFPEFVEIES